MLAYPVDYMKHKVMRHPHPNRNVWINTQGDTDVFPVTLKIRSISVSKSTI